MTGKKCKHYFAYVEYIQRRDKVCIASSDSEEETSIISNVVEPLTLEPMISRTNWKARKEATKNSTPTFKKTRQRKPQRFKKLEVLFYQER